MLWSWCAKRKNQNYIYQNKCHLALFWVKTHNDHYTYSMVQGLYALWKSLKNEICCLGKFEEVFESLWKIDFQKMNPFMLLYISMLILNLTSINYSQSHLHGYLISINVWNMTLLDYLITWCCLAASTWRPGPHDVCTIEYNHHHPGCCWMLAGMEDQQCPSSSDQDEFWNWGENMLIIHVYA